MKIVNFCATTYGKPDSDSPCFDFYAYVRNLLDIVTANSVQSTSAGK